jgi:hypothetical protein
MRFIQPFIACVVCAFLVLSCKKDKDKEEVFTPNPDTNKITLWAGQDTVITLANAAGQYTVTSGNDEIARAVIQDNRIHITTDMPGATTIRVTDQANHTDTIQLEAISLDGLWRRRVQNGILPTSVLVECSDPVFTETLQDELKEEVVEAGMIYGLDFVSTFPPVFWEERFGGRNRGTFSFRNLTLTLTLNNTPEVYRLHPVGLRMFGLEQDLTSQYQTLHPTKGITRVSIIRYYHYTMKPG